MSGAARVSVGDPAISPFAAVTDRDVRFGAVRRFAGERVVVAQQGLHLSDGRDARGYRRPARRVR